MKIEVLNETIRKGKIDLITNWCTSILLSLCGRDRMVSLFWITYICVITLYQYFKFVCSLCPFGLSIRYNSTYESVFVALRFHLEIWKNINNWNSVWKEFEDTKGVIRIRIQTTQGTWSK
jgi:hypothetical protein